MQSYGKVAVVMLNYISSLILINKYIIMSVKMDSHICNILILGKTGVGKSGLLNYLVGENVAESIAGRPCTEQGFHKYNAQIDGLHVRIFDSFGIEVGKTDIWFKILEKKLTEHGIKKDAKEWFYVAIYCIQGAGHRIEQIDSEIINKLITERYHVVIALTKADCINEMDERVLREQLHKDCKISQDMIIATCIGAKNKNDYTESFGKENLTKAIFKGLAHAQFSLGSCYFYGDGVAEDDAEAVKWYRKAAEQEHLEAQYWLGLCYADGSGVTKDEVEAVKWYRKAAERGYVYAQFNLAMCYADGSGVTQDMVEAVKWYRKAAEQGLAFAQNKLGVCYSDGDGIGKDLAEAAEWLRKAAEQGHSGSLQRFWDCVDSDLTDGNRYRFDSLFRKLGMNKTASGVPIDSVLPGLISNRFCCVRTYRPNFMRNRWWRDREILSFFLSPAE